MSAGTVLTRPRLVLASRKLLAISPSFENRTRRNVSSVVVHWHGLSAWGTRPYGSAWENSQARHVVLDSPSGPKFRSPLPHTRRFSSHATEEGLANAPSEHSHADDDWAGYHTADDFSINQRIKLDRRDPLFDKVNRVIDVPIGTLHPLDVAFTCVELMTDCCMLQTLEGMKYARDMLDRLIAEKKHVNKENLSRGEQPMVIPGKTFEKLIFGWARLASDLQVATARMTEVVDLMAQEDLYDKEVKSETLSKSPSGPSSEKAVSCQPTTITYNVILRGLAEAARRYPDVVDEAESLLDTMMNHHEWDGWHTKPNTRSYTHVLTAFANSRAPSAGIRAEQLLERMKEAHESAKEAYEADFGVPYNTLNPETNVFRIVTPDRFVYSAVISAHANSGAKGSAEKAHSLLMELVEGEDESIRPDVVVFTNAINAWTNVASARGHIKGRYRAAERAEELLELMISLSEEEATTRNVPTELDAESEEGEGAEDRDDEKDWGRSSSLSPNVISFNSVLNAWAKSDTREAAPRAEALLQRMLEASFADKTAVQPDRVSFNTVLNAWARFAAYDAEAPQKAEELLNLMYDLYHSGRLDESAKPDSVSYTSVINAWARTGADDEKVANARRLLDTMLYKFEAGETEMKPNVASFTSVLNAAAHCTSSSHSETTVTDEDGFSSTTEPDQNDPYTIALQTYEELRNDSYDINLKPDHFVFATMLKVIGMHTDVTSVERRQMVEKIFDDACAAGQVSSLVIKALRASCPSIDLLQRLMGSRKRARFLQSIDELPRDWTRKVAGIKRFRVVDSTRDSNGRNSRQGRSSQDGRNRRIKGRRQN